MWLQDALSRASAKRSPRHSAAWSECGVYAQVGETPVHVRWEEITSIHAYKRDLLTSDQICLLIANADQEIVFTEDRATFGVLRMVLSKRLELLPDWYLLLIRSPAFKTTLTKIFAVDRNRRTVAAMRPAMYSSRRHDDPLQPVVYVPLLALYASSGDFGEVDSQEQARTRDRNRPDEPLP